MMVYTYRAYNKNHMDLFYKFDIYSTYYLQYSFTTHTNDVVHTQIFTAKNKKDSSLYD